LHSRRSLLAGLKHCVCELLLPTAQDVPGAAPDIVSKILIIFIGSKHAGLSPVWPSQIFMNSSRHRVANELHGSIEEKRSLQYLDGAVLNCCGPLVFYFAHAGLDGTVVRTSVLGCYVPI
jgi:hypothetical protein